MTHYMHIWVHFPLLSSLQKMAIKEWNNLCTRIVHIIRIFIHHITYNVKAIYSSLYIVLIQAVSHSRINKIVPLVIILPNSAYYSTLVIVANWLLAISDAFLICWSTDKNNIDIIIPEIVIYNKTSKIYCK